MRPLIILVTILFLQITATAQNLVPNHSFEQYINCPNYPSQVTTHCANWVQYTTGTSDYFNVCATHPWVDVPSNVQGYQNALHGDAYIGLYDFLPIVPQWEYASTAITAMQTGKVYEVSMSVSLSDSSIYASNGLGAFFFDNGPITYPVTTVLPYIPQISYKDYGPITNKTTWTRLNGYMFADSAYDNIVIGGFIAHNLLQIDTLSSGSYGASYYYIDSVVVRKVNNLNVSLNDSLLCAGDTISLDYSVFVKCFPGNTFTAQLSGPTGSFNNPVNIGNVSSDSSGAVTCIIPPNTPNGTAYRIRLVSSQFPDTSADNGFNIKIGNKDSVTVTISQNITICEGGAVFLSAGSSILSSTFLWTGPNGFNTTVQSPTINNAIPGNSGNYYSTVRFYGCEVKDTMSVTVKPMPAKPVAGSNTPLCAGNTLFFSLSDTTAGAAYSWTGPGSFNSSIQTPSIANTTTAMSGDYIVTANLNGCTRTDTAAVLIRPMPDTITVSSNTPVCAGDTLKLSSDTSTTGVAYLWNGPLSYTASTQNAWIANAPVAATGWYKMTVSLNGCSYADSIYAVVNSVPSAPSLSYNSPLCISETLQLAATTQAGAGYSWSGPGNFASTQQNPTRSNMQFADTGIYKVIRIVNGCSSAESSIGVYINPVPFVVILANPADSICQGDPVVFTAYANNHGGTPSYQWYVNAQTAGTGQIFTTTLLNNQDVVRCDMTENTKCNTPYTDESNDITLQVLPWLAPSVSITANPNRPLNKDEYVTFTALPVNAGIIPLYQWKRNGHDIIGATGGLWSANTLNDNDSISVELVSSYKCPQPTTALSNGIIVKVLSSIGDKGVTNDIQLYPNPNNGSFIISGRAHSTQVARVQVVNALGRVVYEDKVSTNVGKLYHAIELGNTASGVYILKVSTDNGTVIIRFVKQ
jgi:hypothetical protein